MWITVYEGFHSCLRVNQSFWWIIMANNCNCSTASSQSLQSRIKKKLSWPLSLRNRPTKRRTARSPFKAFFLLTLRIETLTSMPPLLPCCCYRGAVPANQIADFQFQKPERGSCTAHALEPNGVKITFPLCFQQLLKNTTPKPAGFWGLSHRRGTNTEPSAWWLASPIACLWLTRLVR